MISLTSNDLDMDVIIAAIQDEPIRFAGLESELMQKKQEIRELKRELDSLEGFHRALQVQFDNIASFDWYQDEAMESAIFGSIEPSIVKKFFHCFSLMGTIAEKAKKTFRDKGGVFDDISSSKIYGSLAEINYCRGDIEKWLSRDNVEGTPERIFYPVFGLVGESGEVADKIHKMIQAGKTVNDLTYEERRSLGLEVSDCLWYVCAVAQELGFSLSDIACMNIEKLRSRRERGTVQGEGDNR